MTDAEVVALCCNIVMAVAAVVTGVCAVKGLDAYKDAKRKEAIARADNAYTKASDGYLEYLELCI
jgi:hypothetical protein